MTADDMKEKADKEVARLPKDLQEIVWIGAALAATLRDVFGPPVPQATFQVCANYYATELAFFLRGRVEGPKA